MARVRYQNFFRTTIANAAGLTASGVSLELTSAAGMPSFETGDWTYLVLIDPDTLDKEIVKVTALSGNTCTIVRAQDGTTARAFARYDTVELRFIKAMLDDVITAANEEGEAVAADAYALAEAARTESAAADAAASAAQASAAAAVAAAAAAQATADLALPAAGGTVTGAITFEGAVQFSGGATGLLTRIGDIIQRLSDTATTGILLCNGAEYDAVTTADYEPLFDHLKAIDAAAFILEDTATAKRFRVPNLTGLVPVGAGTHTDANGHSKTLAARQEVGMYYHQLTANENGPHTHVISNVVTINSTDPEWLSVATPHEQKGQNNPSKSTQVSGLGEAHNNVQPSYGLYFFIVYA